ncbi:MAG: hypothetical protein ACETWQ_11280 [Phycisphaerae bacterium]
MNRESGNRVSGKRAEGGQDEGEGYACTVAALKFTQSNDAGFPLRDNIYFAKRRRICDIDY